MRNFYLTQLGWKGVSQRKTFTLLPFFVFLLFTFSGALAQQATIKGKVTDRKTGDGLVGATVVIQSQNTGASADPNGMYEFKIDPGTYTITCSYVGYKAKNKEVTVSAGQTLTADFALEANTQVMEGVTVIGSRNTNRTRLETPVPVDIIPMKDIIKTTPAYELNQIMTYAAPSFQANRQQVTDGTDHIDPASLRGLGPDQVLVLINGKRRHSTSLVNINGSFGRGSVGTDLNTIPTSAIERVEVLRDGASAQYGSDAIAGVINIVLKKNTDELTAGVNTGVTSYGDGGLEQANTDFGFQVGDKGYVNVAAELTHRGYTDRAGNFTGPVFDPNDPVHDQKVLDSLGLSRSIANLRIGNSEMLNANMFLNSAVPLKNGAEFYAFGGLNYRNGKGAAFYRRPYQDRTPTSIYPNGFLPIINSDIIDQSINMGLRGDVHNWDADFSVGYGMNRFRFSTLHTANASLGAASPTSFRDGGFQYSQVISNLDFTRYYKNILSGFNVAFGGLFRLENYQIFPGEEGSYKNYGLRDVFKTDTTTDGTRYVVPAGQVDVLGKPGGAQGFPGFRPENAVNQFRTNVGAYADLELDLTKSFMIGAAGRFENYSDFGNTVTGKFDARWDITDDFALRGAISTGFRAPSLHQIYFNATSTNFVNSVPVEIGTFRNDSRAAQVLGIPELKQETSVNYSLGLTATPIDNFELTVDAYMIDINNRVILTGNFGGSGDQVDSLLASVGASQARFFTNAVDTRTKGLDVVGTYSIPMPNSSVKISLAANFNKTTAGDVKTTPQLQGKEDTYFNRRDRGRLTELTPKSKFNLSATYARPKLNARLALVYFGEVTIVDINPDEDQTFSPQLVTNLSFSYQLLKQLRFSLGVNNLLSAMPDKIIEANRYFNSFVYPAVQQGSEGAFYKASLSLTIDKNKND